MKYEKTNDYYELLGVAPKADEKELKKAYYKLAQKYHPDKLGAGVDAKAAEEKFKAINNAYDCLKDQDLRKLYDQMREEAKNPSFAERDFGFGGNSNASG